MNDNFNAVREKLGKEKVTGDVAIKAKAKRKSSTQARSRTTKNF